MNPRRRCSKSAWPSRAAWPPRPWPAGRQPRPLHLPQAGHRGQLRRRPDDLEAWRAAVRPTTKTFSAETLGNPKGDVLDFEAVSAIAREHGIPWSSTTRWPLSIWLSRSGTGLMSSSTRPPSSSGPRHVHRWRHRRRGTVDHEGSGRFPAFIEPDPSYHELVFAQLPPRSSRPGTCSKPACSTCDDIGPAVAPLNAFLFLLVQETLSLRMERHSTAPWEACGPRVVRQVPRARDQRRRPGRRGRRHGPRLIVPRWRRGTTAARQCARCTMSPTRSVPTRIMTAA